MRIAFVLAIVLPVLACSISPVVTDGSGMSSARYADCRRAARDYCREVIDPPTSEESRCVAEHTYKCVAVSE